MFEKKIAVLSNVNLNFVIRTLQRDVSVYVPEGYGNELGALLDPRSSYHSYDPEVTFLIMDLAELLGHRLEPDEAEPVLDGWFQTLQEALDRRTVYYISDAYLWCAETEVTADPGRKQELEQLWQKRLEALVRRRENVREFPYRRMIEKMGEMNSFSWKTWYMGKIPLSPGAQEELRGLILGKLRLEERTARKVLALDLDNTLWGGLAGEDEHTPVALSEEHEGLAYKNLQRVLLRMQKQGVLLALVSKNNRGDAERILEGHPHMVLSSGSFAAKRLNWRPKHENLRDIARELNLGLDAFVFWDDNPAERKLVREMLPEVAVPDFPDRPEELACAMAEIYRTYFEKAALTAEDSGKTERYRENAGREEFRKKSSSFEEYLKGLHMTMERVEPERNTERLTQLLNKTNQFNLTTRRYDVRQIRELLESPEKRVFLYRSADCFGDNGIVAAVVADCSGDIPVISDFVMSCRVMGRRLEYAVIEDVERELFGMGRTRLRGVYVPTSRNAPAAGLYEELGYREIGGKENGRIYEASLPSSRRSMHFVDSADTADRRYE